ncbi:MAG: hypothetical protein IPP48_04145 [Chitinophagaceae bacterium]|nr:hypothetical protein [Chitinophagaceae bacterium]
MYPEKLEDKTLVQQMIEKGKRLYVLSKILPKTKEHFVIGYTEQQLKDCYSHEAVIWNLFAQNNLFQTIDNNIIKTILVKALKRRNLAKRLPEILEALPAGKL